MNVTVIESKLVDFLRTITGQVALQADSDLQDAGITDSLTMMDLLVFIETEYQVRLGFADLTPDVFQTPTTVAELIAAQLALTQQSQAA
ncbi:MAG: hypothetical protein EXS05_20470 [Planctomycetaceae bacterium]|nr:hypothetical protein [Planctomycetaceae bacterium]